MKIGINASVFYKVGYSKYYGENTYKKLKEIGYSCVDLSALGDQNSLVCTLPEEESKALLLKEKSMADEAGIEIWQAHGPVKSLARALTEKELEDLLRHTKKSIRDCAIIGCKNLVVHPAMPFGWSDRGSEIAKDTFDFNVKFLTELSDYAKDYGVIICYENLPCIGYSISTPEEIIAVVDTVNRDNVKVCLDIGHLLAFSYSLKAGEEIRRLGNRIQVLHCHDTYGGADQHSFPQLGGTNWKEVAAALKEIGFSGVFSLEINFPDHLPEDLFEESCYFAYKLAKDVVKDI